MTRKKPASDAKKGKKARKKQPKGLAVYTEGGAVPLWVTLARTVLVLALAATIPFVAGVEPGRRLLWAAAIPSLPVFWVLGGYHMWRRLCPLAVLAQLARLIGHPGSKRVDAKSWLAKNYMLLQLGIMFVALSLRLIMTNGTPLALAGFLAAAALIAIIISFAYTGKTWCNYVCPVGMVEKFYTEPARLAGPKNSQCSPCTACKKNCPDIDLEQGYWKELMQGARRVSYYAWPGLVLGFYTYYYLVAGDWDYYFSGAWTLEDTQISTWLNSGFFFAGSIPIVVAAPLTLLVFGGVSVMLFMLIESLIRRGRDLDEDQSQRIRHRMLAVTGLLAFLLFYYFGGQPTIRLLPSWFATGFASVVTIAATAIFVRRYNRDETDFVHEKFAEKILKKWEWGDAPESGRLQDIYVLHHERKKQRDARLDAYKETIREMVTDGLVTKNELALLDSLRAQLGIGDKDHDRIVAQLGEEERQLFDPGYQGSVEQRIQTQQYRNDLRATLVAAARAGASADDADIEAIRLEYGIEEDEHERMLAELRGDSGPIVDVCRKELASIRTLGSAIAAATGTRDAQQSTSVALLGDLCRLRAAERMRRAMQALKQIHPEIEPRKDANLLLSANPADRRKAAEHLSQYLEAELVSELSGAANAVWAEANSSPTAGALIELTADPSAHIRAIAAHVLSRFDEDDAREAVVLCMDDDATLVREAATYALGIRGRLRRELMAKALKDSEERVRRAAVVAMSPSDNDPKLALARADVAKTVGAFATLDANARIETSTTLERMALLRKVPLFAKLEPEDLEEASTLATERVFDAGEMLCVEGDPGEEVFVLVEGRVEVSTGEGDQRRVIGSSGAGGCIGEMSVVDAAPRSATVVATEATRTLVLPAAEFRHLIDSRPAVGQAVIDVLVTRLRGVIAQNR